MSRAVRNTFYSSLNIYLEFAVGLVISILIARSLGPSEYGVYAYLVKVAGIAIILTNAGVSTGAIKFVAEARAKGNSEQISAIYRFFNRVQLIKSSLVVVSILTVHQLFPGLLFDSGDALIVLALLAAIIFKSSHMFHVGILKGYERFDLLALLVIVVCPANLAAVIVCHLFESGLRGFFLVFGVVGLIYWLTSLVLLRRRSLIIGGEQSLDAVLKRRIGAHLKIVSINTIVGGLVLGQIEVLFLKYMVGNEAVAFFNVALVLATAAMSLVPGVYSAILFPIIAKSVADSRLDEKWQIQQSTRYLMLLGLMVAIPSSFYSSEIVVLFYGESFSPAGPLLVALALIAVLRAFADPVSALLLSTDNQATMLKICIFSLIIAVLAHVGFISRFGMYGAVYAYALVFLCHAGMLVYVARRMLQVRLAYNMIFRGFVASVLSLGPLLCLNYFVEGLWAVMVGFPIYAMSFIFLTIVLRAFSNEDYRFIDAYAIKVSPRTSRYLRWLVGQNVRHSNGW